MKNFKKKANTVFLFFVLSSFLFTTFIGFPVKLSNNTDEINFSNISINRAVILKDSNPKDNLKNSNNLMEQVDLNSNGISDTIEKKIDSLKSLEVESNQGNKLKIIVNFPKNYDYTNASSYFKDCGGEIQHTYKYAINGFAGTINYENLESYYTKLKLNNIEFFIDEDGTIKSNLYYASRNMRLRPHVWNTLGYTGDNDSSIAILDSGIDVDHEFFDNYTDDNFQYKIVGWEDFVNFPPTGTPEDDNGHGSHCAGIAAGMGTPVVDGLGRQIATAGLYEDFWPYAFIDDYSFEFPLATFNVTNTGEIEIECNFTDFTNGPDRIYGRAILYQGNNQLDLIGDDSDNWYNNLSATVSTGVHMLSLKVTFDDLDVDADPYVWDPLIRFRGEIHWPFNPNSLGSGNYWKGVAPDTHLVGVKVLDQYGSGSTSDVLAGVNWVISEKETYNITVMSLSLGGKSIDTLLIDALENAVDQGIVTVVAAGNDGSGGFYTDFPGIVDDVITVGATNYKDQIARYSSQGGTYYSTSKPDIVAVGGSVYDLTMFSADTDDNDAEGNFTIDYYDDDLQPAQGTSMATPIVAGAAALLVQAMGGGNQWDWSAGSANAKMVKSLLLMTATETFPLTREVDTEDSPTLERGGKDVHEGYGRINIDAAIEAWTNNLTNQIESSSQIKVWLNTSQYNPLGKHAYAGYVNLIKDQWYLINVSVPSGSDYDLHIYNETYDAYGQPVMVASSISAVKGRDEVINFTAPYTAKYFLVIKAIGKAIPSGGGDNDGDKATVLDITLFVIIGGIVALIAIVIVIIAYKKSSKDYSYEYRPEY